MPIYRSTAQVPNTIAGRRVAHARVSEIFLHLSELEDRACTLLEFNAGDRRVYLTITGQVIQQRFLDEFGLEPAP